MLVAGHICLDIIPDLLDAEQIRPGRLVAVGPATVSTGGAVANVGSALHRLGERVQLVASVGDDAFGRVILEALRAIDPALADSMIVVPGAATSYSVVISPPGVDRSFLHCAGTNDTFDADDVPDAALASARIMHIGYPPLMARMYEQQGARLRALLERARAAGAVSSLDLCDLSPETPAGRIDWEALLGGVLPFVDVFAPSLDELCFMLRRPPAPLDLRLVVSVAEWALEAGAAIAAIKLGDQGLYVRTGDGAGLARVCDRLGLDRERWRRREVLAPCFAPRRFGGTTGSGDATIAGLLAALLRGEGPVGAATVATAVGAFSVEEPDATSGVPDWEMVARHLSSRPPRLPLDQGLVAGVRWQRDEHGTLFDPMEIR